MPETLLDVILQVTEFLHNKHVYIQGFKTAMQQLCTPDMMLIIRDEKTPCGGHVRRFNGPATNEVAVCSMLLCVHV